MSVTPAPTPGATSPAPAPAPEPAASALLALPLFPLQAVLFPGGLLPLRVYEARYLDLIGSCVRAQSPFGVVCLTQGQEVGTQAKGMRIESTGVLAYIDDIDSDQAGILRVRCTGSQRFQLSGAPHQQANGLWVAPVQLLPLEALLPPPTERLETVTALEAALVSLQEQGTEAAKLPWRLQDAGWVANRWCELLPISLAAKQKLMELEDPQVRLQLVDEFLRSKRVLGAA